MTIQVFFIIIIVIVERYVSKTNTRKHSDDSSLKKPEDEKFFENKIMKHSSKSDMTIKLRTFNTHLVDVKDANTQEYLKKTFG